MEWIEDKVDIANYANETGVVSEKDAIRRKALQTLASVKERARKKKMVSVVLDCKPNKLSFEISEEKATLEYIEAIRVRYKADSASVIPIKR